MGNETFQLPQAAIDAISARLAALADLRLPAQLRAGASEQQRQDYLKALLLHDPGVFLERHGSSLSPNERAHFEPLRGDYEVDFYLKVLEEERDAHTQARLARQRRLAAMQRLEAEGAYFSEEEMRERQPALFRQYVGQFRPPERPQGPGEGCQAGTILADSIMRQQEELGMRQRAEAEERQWRRAEAAAAAQESEEESSDDDEEEERGTGEGSGAGPWGELQQQQQQQAEQAGQQQHQGEAAAAEDGRQQQAGQQAGRQQQQQAAKEGDGKEAEAEEVIEEEEEGEQYVRIPAHEQAEYAATFLDLMKQRFLAGEDAGVDYGAIDADAELDEDWAVQQGRDAEDAYFKDA